MNKLLDPIVRWLAKRFLLKYIDGWKTEIGLAYAAINAILLLATTICTNRPELSVQLCGVVAELNTTWLAYSAAFNAAWLGFAVQDANAKERAGG